MERTVAYLIGTRGEHPHIPGECAHIHWLYHWISTTVNFFWGKSNVIIKGHIFPVQRKDYRPTLCHYTLRHALFSTVCFANSD